MSSWATSTPCARAEATSPARSWPVSPTTSHSRRSRKRPRPRQGAPSSSSARRARPARPTTREPLARPDPATPRSTPRRCPVRTEPASREIQIRIDGLVEVDPEDSREAADERSQRQEQHDPRHDAPLQGPARDDPDRDAQDGDHDDAQGEADVHGPEEVAGLSLEPQAAHSAPLLHPGETPHDRRGVDLALAAPGAEPAADAGPGGRAWGSGAHDLGERFASL